MTGARQEAAAAVYPFIEHTGCTGHHIGIGAGLPGACWLGLAYGGRHVYIDDRNVGPWLVLGRTSHKYPENTGIRNERSI